MEMPRRRKSEGEEPDFCCEVSEMISRWGEASDHLRIAKRELLLFLKAVVDRELEEVDNPRPSSAARKRRIKIREV